MITFASAVRVGDFVQIRQHKAQDRLRMMWWRVTAIRITRTSERLELVNRHGQTARYIGQHVKVNRWMPGEDNRDESAIIGHGGQ